MNSVKNGLHTVANYADVTADIVNSVIDCEFHCPYGQFISSYDVE